MNAPDWAEWSSGCGPTATAHHVSAVKIEAEYPLIDALDYAAYAVERCANASREAGSLNDEAMLRGHVLELHLLHAALLRARVQMLRGGGV